MSQAIIMQPTVTISPFGTTPNGDAISAYTLTNKHGTQAVVINFGAILQSLKTQDKNGDFADIVLGFEELAPYLTNPTYFGATIGRFGNRIGNGQCEIDGETYTFLQNNGNNHLHGGAEGFDKKVWQAEAVSDVNSAGVVLTLVSPDGDQGYPGTLTVKCEYHLTNDDELVIKYTANTDKTTIINLTNHSYFNLKEQGTILDHLLEIPTSKLTPVDDNMLPTGEIRAITGTPFDFPTAKTIGQDIDADDQQLKIGAGYDHNYYFDKDDGELSLVAKTTEPASGRVLAIYTTEPGFQLYTGNFIGDDLSGKGRQYGKYAGFCVEPQHVPDAPNKPMFKSTLLTPEQTYTSEMRYVFSVVK